MKPILEAKFVNPVRSPNDGVQSVTELRNPDLTNFLQSDATHVMVTGKNGNRVLVPFSNVRHVVLPPEAPPVKLSRSASSS